MYNKIVNDKGASDKRERDRNERMSMAKTMRKRNT